MTKINKKETIKIEILSPTHVGAGSEKDWVKGADFIVDNNKVKIISLKKAAQYVNISALSNALLENNSVALKNNLGANIDKCVERVFDCKYSGNNDIKTLIKNQLTGNPIIPGSSIKGAVRSVLFNYLGGTSKDGKEVFGSSTKGDEFMRFIKFADAEFDGSELVNSKIFNLHNQNGFKAGWKHGRNKTDQNLKPNEFNTFFEVLMPNQRAFTSISISEIGYKNFEKFVASHIKNEKKKPIVENDIKYLFGIINEHTKKYIQKQLEFFNKYGNNETPAIIENLKQIQQQISNDNSSCVLKMASGSGFHSITGDWQHHYFSINGVDSSKKVSQGTLNGKKSAKSRKIAISSANDFSLMGFVKLTVMNEKMLAEIEKEEQRKTELAKLQLQHQQQRLQEQQKLELEAKKKEFENLISQAQTHYQNNDYKSAISLIEQAEALDLDNVTHHELKQDILKAIELQSKLEEIEARKQEDEEKRKAETEAKLASGLAAYLEEKNLKDEYIVRNFKMIKAKTEKYLKDSANEKLPENEFTALEHCVKRVYHSLNSFDQKKWLKFDNNKIWQAITNFTSNDFAKTVYDKIMA